jgi:hypothetical protein
MWLFWLPMFFLMACHRHSPTQSTSMAVHYKNYIVSTKVIGMRQQDLSKVQGKSNMYSYLDLQIMQSSCVDDADEPVTFDTCHVTRRSLPGDENIKTGDFLRLEIAVGAISQPQYVTWVKRME